MPTPVVGAGPNIGDGVAGPSFRKAAEAVATIVAPTTLVTALLYYFGWVRTHSQSELLGLDNSIFGFSTQDYLLRSISAMYLPIGTGLLIALLWLAAHSSLIRWAPRPGADSKGGRVRLVKTLVASIATTGVLSFVIGIYWAFLRTPRIEMIAPLSLGLGIALSSYAVHLYRRLLARPHPMVAGSEELRWLPPLQATMVVLLVCLSLFWAVSDYAVVVGRGLTEQMISNLSLRPSVLLYSNKRLYLDGTGVEETRLEGHDEGYRFRYSGLKFLVRSGGKHFLLPASWSFSKGSTFVLPDGDDLRLEFVHGGEQGDSREDPLQQDSTILPR